MKIVLLKNVEKLGKVGEIKNVNSGFASNFLIPNKMAQPATKNVVKKVEEQLKLKNIKKEDLLKNFKELAKKINGKEFKIERKAKDGKLFGSVKAMDIVDLIKNDGFEIKEKNIIFAKPIKELGEFKIEIQVKDDIKAKIKLIIKEKK